MLLFLARWNAHNRLMNNYNLTVNRASYCSTNLKSQHCPLKNTLELSKQDQVDERIVPTRANDKGVMGVKRQNNFSCYY